MPCKNGWCQVNSSVIQGGNGFVEQAHLKFPQVRPRGANLPTVLVSVALGAPVKFLNDVLT
jgi:hypothetical protein